MKNQKGHVHRTFKCFRPFPKGLNAIYIFLECKIRCSPRLPILDGRLRRLGMVRRFETQNKACAHCTGPASLFASMIEEILQILEISRVSELFDVLTNSRIINEIRRKSKILPRSAALTHGKWVGYIRRI